MRIAVLVPHTAAFILAAIISMPACASDLSLGVTAQVFTPASATGSGVRRLETTLSLDFDTSVVLCVPAGADDTAMAVLTDTSRCRFDEVGGYPVRVSASKASGDSVLINFSVLSGRQPDEPASISRMLVQSGTNAAFEIGARAGSPILRLSFSPRLN